MIVKDSVIAEVVAKIAEHYNTNIATRFIRPLLSGILSDNELSRGVSDLTENTEVFVVQGVHIDELYSQIIAMARFVSLVRTDVLPNLRALSSSAGHNDANRVFRDMAISNFPANIKVLADLVNELYMRTVEFDKRKCGNHRPVYLEIPALEDLGRYLVEK